MSKPSSPSIEPTSEVVMAAAGVRALRGDYERLPSWAKEQYAAGKNVREVMTEVYGVDLPLEAYVFHRSRPRQHELPIDRCFYPWELIEMAGPRYQDEDIAEHEAEIEKRELARDRDFLPLGSLEGSVCEWEGYMIGYSIERLRRGDLSILGYPYEQPEQETIVLGPSLLETLHLWMTDVHARAKAILEHPANRRRGSDIDVVASLECLKAIEKLQQKHAEQLAAATTTTTTTV